MIDRTDSPTTSAMKRRRQYTPALGAGAAFGIPAALGLAATLGPDAALDRMPLADLVPMAALIPGGRAPALADVPPAPGAAKALGLPVLARSGVIWRNVVPPTR